MMVSGAFSQRDAAGPDIRRSVLALMRTSEFGLAVGIAIFCAYIEIRNPAFGHYSNLILVLKAAAPAFVASVATTFLIVGGGLDLSIGSVVALSGVIVGEMLIHGFPIVIAIILTLVAAAAIGAVHGVLVAKAQIPALIVTLGALYVWRGVALRITNALFIYPLPNEFNAIGQGSWGKVPLLVIYGVVAGVIGHVVLNHTRFGYHVRATGGNPDSARSSGIKITQIRLALYMLSACGSAVAGILFTSNLGTADSTSYVGFELTVIAAVIIGGTSLFGGVGNVVGTALGSALIALIQNGLILVSISPYYQEIVVGTVVVGAVGLDRFRRTELWSRAARRETIRGVETTAR